MLKLEYYVPEAQLEATTGALFAIGAGRVGNYDCCCWVTEGVGQFRPLPGSRPFIGSEGGVSREPELKVEMVLADHLKAAAVAALHAAHPYETPAYQLLPFEH